MGYTKCFFFLNLPIQWLIKSGFFTDLLMGSMSPSRVIIYWESSGGGIIADAKTRPQNLTFAQDDIIYHFFPTKFASWLVSQQFAATTLRRHLGPVEKKGRIAWENTGSGQTSGSVREKGKILVSNQPFQIYKLPFYGQWVPFDSWT